VRRLAAEGFENVRNLKVDCYEEWKNGSFPPHQIFLTNPPYSGDHIEKLMKFLTASRSQLTTPWFLLMPQWVVKKDFYDGAISKAGIRPFYLVPRKRYVYLPPQDFRSSRKSDTHKKSSPFISMWFCWGGSQDNTDRLVRDFSNNTALQLEMDLARSKSALRDLRRKKR